MRDELLAGQCALCKRVIEVKGRKYVCARCARYRERSFAARTVIVLPYPAEWDGVPQYVMLHGKATARRHALELLAGKYLWQYELVPAYCPTGMTLARWGQFMQALGFQWAPLEALPSWIRAGFHPATLGELQALPGGDDSYLLWKEYQA